MGLFLTDPRPTSIPHLMTGYTVHTGSNQKFSQGWDQIFSGQTPKAQATKPAKTPAAAKLTKAAQPAKKARKSQ
jgi:hypothetical protein